MLNDKQLKNYAFFNKCLPEWIEDELKLNKFAVIQGEQLKGLYDSFESAFEYAYGTFPENDFIIQQILEQDQVVEFLRSAVI